MIHLLRTLYAAVRGHNCSDCGVRPLRQHKPDCPTGAWDGGTWA